MTKHNTQLSVYNIESYLDQINKNMTKDTQIKIKFRAGNFLMRTGGLKNLRHSLNLLNESHDLSCEVYGSNHTRSYNILYFIINCETKIEKLNKAKKEEKKKTLENKNKSKK